MNIHNKALVDSLASQYVLGTLEGRARKRFENLASAHPNIRKRIDFWEKHFAQVAATIPSETPPTTIWKSIEKRLWDSDQQENSKRFSFWDKFAAVMGTAAFVVLAFVLIRPLDDPPDLTDLEHLALVGETDQPLWLITFVDETRELQARAVNALAAELDQVYELWLLQGDLQPESLGLLPVNGETQTRELPAGLASLIFSNATLAVSLEPVGGSPTGLPTGPVVQTATLIDL